LPYATTCINCQREAEKTGGRGRGIQGMSRLFDSFSDSESSSSDVEVDVS
jgi:RNA polymerase-binding transcription factor DksA